MIDRWPELLPNERRILNQVQISPGVTQREIGNILDVPQQTVSRQINDLLERGLLRAGDRVSGGQRGHPSLSLTIEPDALYSLGVSIMADAISMMLVDLTGRERGYRLYHPGVMSRAMVLDTVARGLDELAGEAGIEPQRIPGIGIAITGFLSSRHTFNTPRSLDEWADIDVAAPFAERFGRPAWADNDGNAAAIGESLVGAGRWAQSFAYLYIATGFGGGVIANGTLLSGRHGNAGEYGTMLQPGLHPNPSLELLRQTMALRGTEYADVSTLLENFDIDAPGVSEWIAKVSDSLSFVCGASMGILDPDAIVLGGRIPKSLAARLIPHIVIPDFRRRGQGREMIPIVPAEAQGDATALGAAVMPLHMHIFGREQRL